MRCQPWTHGRLNPYGPERVRSLNNSGRVQGRLQADQLMPERSYPIAVSAAPPKLDPYVAAIGPTQVRKRLSEPRHARLRDGIVFVAGRKHADASHAVALLRVARADGARRGRRHDAARFHDRRDAATAQLTLRSEMARQSAQYCHPKLSAVEYSGPAGDPIEVTEISDEETARALAVFLARIHSSREPPTAMA